MLFYSTELLTQVPIAVWLPANRAKKLYRKRVFVLPGKKPTTRRTYVKSLSRHKIAKIITIMGVEPSFAVVDKRGFFHVKVRVKGTKTKKERLKGTCQTSRRMEIYHKHVFCG